MKLTGTVQERLIELLRRHSGVSDITPGTRFVDDLQFDSLDGVEMEIAVENEFGIVVKDGETDGIRTVGEAVHYLGTKGVE